jgi:hypothetical protein
VNVHDQISVYIVQIETVVDGLGVDGLGVDGGVGYDTETSSSLLKNLRCIERDTIINSPHIVA